MRALAIGIVVAAAAAVATAAPLSRDDTDRAVRPPIPAPDGPPIVGTPEEPRGHFRVTDPLALEPAEAESLYQGLLDEMVAGYALSRHSAAAGYRDWRRFNTAPFRSSPHGNRYVSVYANAAAAAYGTWEDVDALPEGAMIAKDSFTVTDDGLVAPAALFVMEKMAPGFNPVGGDWRYTMVLPDGSVYGTTHGAGSERVRYCIACHMAARDTDHLHLVPEAYRAEPPSR